MTPPNIFYSVLLSLAGIICLIVAILIWQQRRAAVGAASLIILMFALTWWDITYALFWAVAPAPNPYFWLDITYVGVVIVPPAFLAFIIQYTQLEGWLKPPFLFALTIEPVLVLLLMWTDSWHGLFFAGKRAENTVMILDGGAIMWVNIFYSYLLLLVACSLLIRRYRNASGLYRRQTATVLIAAGLPWASSLCLLFGGGLLPGADNTPFAFSLTGIAFAYALLRYRLLDVVPIARHALVESMTDGVLVLDAQNRVVDLNPAAQSALVLPVTQVIGQPVGVVLAAWPLLLHQFLDTHETHTEFDLGEQYLDLQISPLHDPRGLFVGRLIVWRDISYLKHVQAELETLATTDALTQAMNRRQFLDLAGQELSRAKRLHHPLTVALLDIDHFKGINDTYGHANGDRALAAFAHLCRDSIREIDLFARFGGEEFTLLMPETTLEQARQVTERLCHLISELRFATEDGQIFSITCSFGIAALQNQQDTLELILSHADQALYRAKALGRNRVVVWNQES